MRIIIAGLAMVSIALGQTAPRIGTPAYFEMLEKRVTQTPGDLAVRSELLGAYTDFGLNSGLPIENVRQARRRHLLWFIVHRPDVQALSQPHQSARLFGEPPLRSKGGGLADPAGYAEAAQLWKQVTAAPNVAPTVILNAAVFFAIEDRQRALALLDRVRPQEEANPAIARTRAMLEMMEWLEAKQSPAARKAFADIDTSRNPALLGSAGVYLVQATQTVSDPESLRLAERWLQIAHQLQPENREWHDHLRQVFIRRGSMTSDPKERAQLYRSALDMMPEDDTRIPILLWLTAADFEAGNPTTAEDARRMLETAEKSGVSWRANLLHSAHSVLGRLALRRGDIAQANLELAASASLPGPPFDGMSLQLAQELLDRGELKTVLAYLEACRKVWPKGGPLIEYNIALIQSDTKPKLVTELPRAKPKQLAVPEQLTPADGFTLASGASHRVRVSWKPVEGAYAYLVDWNYREDDVWKFERLGGGGVFSRTTSADFTFPNAVSGRWRVFALAAPGHEAERSEASPWREFQYPK